RIQSPSRVPLEAGPLQRLQLNLQSEMPRSRNGGTHRRTVHQSADQRVAPTAAGRGWSAHRNTARLVSGDGAARGAEPAPDPVPAALSRASAPHRCEGDTEDVEESSPNHG